MSTALVSAFYDVGDVLYKQASRSQLRGDRKAVGTPIGTQRRHSSNGTLTIGNGSNNKTSTSLVSGLTESTLLNNKENRHRDRAFSESDGTNSKRNQINSSRYKTELCRPFEENGTCKYGDKCQFAHGIPEVRSLNRHPKYKTELCRTFHTVGFCPYGPRCHFIHSAEEKRTPQQNVQDNVNVRNMNTSMTRTIERPKTLFHSLSFSGTSSTDMSPTGMPISPTSLTPPPAFYPGDGIQLNFNTTTTNSLNNNANTFNFAQDLPPLMSPMSPASGSPTSPFNFPSPLPAAAINDTFIQQHQHQQLMNVNDNLNSVFLSDADGSLSPSPSESLSGSDQESLGGSISSTSPLDRRLPIFSRLSIDE
ncbi:mRNA decay activator protein ZFP36L1-like [Ptychodera flava]|uniref:mRNA decay activator protein ZFP36L1-like n=1 Tax=Ptychodera flava TaxID=63121 RepID=UPI00396A6C1C